MDSFNTLKKASNIFTFTIFLLINSMVFTTSARAAEDTRLHCETTQETMALNLGSLGITLSPSIPIGTVIYEGTMSISAKCALDYTKYSDDLSAEVYLKRFAIPEGSLGYGLTLYLGYGGEYTTEAGNVRTGIIINTYGGITGGGILNNDTEFTLNVPYKIVRTSSSLTQSSRTTLSLFQIGSLVPGRDEAYTVGGLRSRSVTVKDETCSAAGNTNQQVHLGTYSINTTKGLGAGIGETSQMTPFNIQLNCEALLSGRFDVQMRFDGDTVSGLSDSGVLALKPDSSAQGVGVQLLNTDKNPVALATPFTVASYPLNSALITVPFYARYYQIAEKVTGGTANAVVTYTLSYQ